MIKHFLLLLTFLSSFATIDSNAQLAKKFFMSTARNQLSMWKLTVKYNSTDYTYLTTAPYSDTDTEGFQANSNVIEVENLITDDYLGSDNANTGLTYDFANDWFGVKDWGPEITRFFDRSLVEQHTIQGEGNQGIAWNHNTQTLIEYDGTTLKEFSNTGTLLYSQGSIGGVGYSSGGLAYNPFTGELFLSNVSSTFMRIYKKIGGSYVFQNATWWGVGEGIGYDYINDKIVTYVGGAIEIRTRDGQYNFKYPLPTLGSEAVTEGITPDPRDGTFWFNADEHFHGGIVDGNRTWHTDPRKWYGKFIRFPDMIRYEMFKLANDGNSHIVGTYNYEKIHSNDWSISPVIDFEAFTGQQTLSNWTSSTGNFDIEFRGSGTAPTTTPVAGPPPHDLAFYNANLTSDGWGATTPGAWQSTPTSTQYMQFRVKALPPSPAPTGWTPLSLGSKLKIWGTPRELTRVGKDAKDTDVQIIMNRANLANGGDGSLLQGGADSFKGTFTEEGTTSADEPENRRGYVRFSGNRHLIVAGAIGTTIESDTQGEWNVFGKRVTANTRSIWFSEMNTATVTDQFRIFSFPSGGGTANWTGFQILDGAGAVTLTCGVTNATTNWQMLTFGADATELYLYIDNVKQTLTCSTGSVTPAKWYGTVAGDQVAIGIIDTSGSTVTGDAGIRDYIYTDPLTTLERTEYFNYGTGLGYR